MGRIQSWPEPPICCLIAAVACGFAGAAFNVQLLIVVGNGFVFMAIASLIILYAVRRRETASKLTEEGQ
jgi:hypothetical protein